MKLPGVVGEEIVQSLSQFKLKDHVLLPGYLTHTEALQLQYNAQLLLLVEMNRPEIKTIIPGKLFEYLSLRRPIIALGPEGSDIKTIIDETDSGCFFSYTEEVDLKRQLLRYFEAFQEGRLSQKSVNIEKYSRRELTKRLAELLLSPPSVSHL